MTENNNMAAMSTASSPIEGYSQFSNEVAAPETPKTVRRARDAGRDVDVPNEFGSTHSLSGSDFAVELMAPDEFEPNSHWDINYQEAAIFLEEGENNEKFDSHPKSANALPAYVLVHNKWYHGVDAASSIVLLALAFVEEPAVPASRLPVGLHGSIELLCLLVIGGALALKLRWIGWRTLLKHKRTMIKCVTLFIMVIETFIVLIRQTSHFRVTRALRPIFIVDTKYCGGVRRFIRQILQSLPPIIDMMGLVLFFVSMYSMLGYFLFSQDKYFQTLSDSFFSLFVLLTTANFPDVMMPSYSRSKWNAVFFISYLCIVLYVLMNLMLAVVYETFTRIEMDKFRKLLAHKRSACQHAFRLLVTRQDTNHISLKQFQGLFKYYAPQKSARDVVLMFKYLDKTNSGRLTLDSFYNVYDANMLKWRGQLSHAPWYHSLWPPMQTICQYSYNLIAWPYFDYIVYLIIIANLIAMLTRSLEFQNDDIRVSARLFCAAWDSILFLILCLLEVILKILGLGVTRYFYSGWNVFDFVVTVSGLFGVFIILLFPSFTYVVILRPLRLIRLFKMKKRYRDVFGTVVILSPLMCSAAIVMLVMFYFFAIIGMELFAGYDLRNCCVNTTVEDFYKYNKNASSGIGYYYLNTFQDLLTSGVTLFELTVVNNWFIVMNGYVSVAHPYSRLYFIVFYLFTMVVLTIVVASVLQAFRFRIHYKRHTSKKDEEKMLHEEVHLLWDEIQRWMQDYPSLEEIRKELTIGGTTTFIGRRPRNREVLQRRMYRREIEEWVAEESQHKLRSSADTQLNDYVVREGSDSLQSEASQNTGVQ